MEIVSTGVLNRNKECYLGSKDKESLYIYNPKISTDNHIMWIIKSYSAYTMYQLSQLKKNNSQVN